MLSLGCLLASGHVAAAATIPAGNLTINPSFESGTSGWSGSDSSISRVSDSGAAHGAYAVKVSSRVLAVGAEYAIDDSPETLISTAADTYRASAWVKANAKTKGAEGSLVLVETEPDGTPVGESSALVALSHKGYRQVKVEREISPGNRLGIRVRVLGDRAFRVLGSEEAFFVDAVTMERIDAIPPARPSIGASSPASPAADNEPRLSGSAEDDATVKIYASVDCSGSPIGSGTSSRFSYPGLTVSVADNSTTTFTATATDAAGNVSDCSEGITYAEDSTAPARPLIDGSTPPSPANKNSLALQGVAEEESTVELFRSADCSGAAEASGAAAGFADPGFAVSVEDDSSTQFTVRAIDEVGNASACSGPLTYVEDSSPPMKPSIESSSPTSPASENSPFLRGSAGPGNTIKIFEHGSCSGTPVVTGLATEFADRGLPVSVPDASTTSFSAVATDGAGNASACSDPFTYVEDSSAPPPPSIDGSSPTPPADENSPALFGSAEPGTAVKLYPGAGCSGAEVASGGVAQFSEAGLTVSVADNSTTTFTATATDAAGNVSGCSAGFTFVEETPPPAAPSIEGSSPDSPADHNSPELHGSAEPGEAVELFEGADCTGPTVASGSADQFADPGLVVTVADNTTTNFTATATDGAGNVSQCSDPFTYVEESAPPACASQFGIEGGASCNDILVADPMTDPDPSGLWGGAPECDTEAESVDGRARHSLRSTGGDEHATATGGAQGDGGAFRRLTVFDGDDFYGERCELGRNTHRFGNDGTFQLFKEGHRKITYASLRLPTGYPLSERNWQVLMQMKQTQPSNGGGGTPVLALHASDGRWRLMQSTSNGPATNTQEIWSAPAELNAWTRFAFDIRYSQDPTVGTVDVHVDLNGDGDSDDPNERGGPITTYTLKYETGGSSSDGVLEGDSIPSHLRVGIYHDRDLDCPPPTGCSVDVDNVQVLAR